MFHVKHTNHYTTTLIETLEMLPSLPGVYQYSDSQGKIIYVGKAKNLKKRVSSYFNKEHTDRKTTLLVAQIASINYTIVRSEHEALLLENRLIKNYKPKYNILLKDDKSYPYLQITNESFPRVITTRRKNVGEKDFFGPYTSKYFVRETIDFLHKSYPLRSCSLSLEPDRIENGKYKECLKYHLKLCNAPCRGWETEDKYNGYIDEIRDILRGNSREVIGQLLQQMSALAAEQRFEDAQCVKRRWEAIQLFKEKATVVNDIKEDLAVFSICATEQEAYVNFMNVHKGAIIQSLNYTYKKKLDETDGSILATAIIDTMEQLGNLPKELVVSTIPEGELEGMRVTVPQKGEKRKIIDLSLRNAKQHQLDKLKMVEKRDPKLREDRILQKIKQDLRLQEIPYHIECFDNSNTQGTNPVSACVVFKNGKPSKRDYRHFKVKTVEGPNDYATMREVIIRRYTRLIAEGQPLPQLIVVDGGKGQLSTAVEALRELGIYGQTALIGLAERLEEIYFPNDQIPIYINKNSSTLKVIQHLRDEAHRFGITFHRKLRSKSQTRSILDEIKGIGKATKEKLIAQYGTIRQIRQAPIEEINALIGEDKAKKLTKGLENG